MMKVAAVLFILSIAVWSEPVTVTSTGTRAIPGVNNCLAHNGILDISSSGSYSISGGTLTVCAFPNNCTSETVSTDVNYVAVSFYYQVSNSVNFTNSSYCGFSGSSSCTSGISLFCESTLRLSSWHYCHGYSPSNAPSYCDCTPNCGCCTSNGSNVPSYQNVTASVTFGVRDEINPCDSLLRAYADTATAFVTGNFGRYQAWGLQCGKKEVFTVPLTSYVPTCDNVNCLNAAGTIDEGGNWLSDGFNGPGRQALWLDPTQIPSDFGRCQFNEDGYFVTCARNINNECLGNNCNGWVWDDTIPPSGPPPFIPPEVLPSSASGWQSVPGGGAGSGQGTPDMGNLPNIVSDGFARLSTWQELLANRIAQMSNSVTSSVNAGWDWLKEQFKATSEPELDASDYDLNQLNVDSLPTQDTLLHDWDSSIFAIDSSFMDKLKKEITDSMPDMDTTQFSLDKLLDSLPKPPSEDSLAADVADKMKQITDDVKHKVETAFLPITLLVTGSGSCNCLADSFTSMSFIGMNSDFTVSGPAWALSKLCDYMAVVRLIVLLVCTVGNIGLILWVLRQ